MKMFGGTSDIHYGGRWQAWTSAMAFTKTLFHAHGEAVFTLDEACDGIVHGYIVGIILFTLTVVWTSNLIFLDP